MNKEVYKFLFLFCFAFLSFLLAKAAPGSGIIKADSLARLAEKTSVDTLKLKYFSQAAKIIRSENPEKAAEYAKKILPLAQKTENYLEQAEALHVIGYSYYSRGELDSARHHYSNSLSIYKKIENKEGVANMTYNLGISDVMKGNYKDGLQRFLTALRIWEKLGSKEDVSNVYISIAIVHGRQKNTAKELEYSKKGLAIKRELGDKYGVAAGLINIGSAYSRAKEYDEALRHYKEGLAIAREIKYQRWILNALGNIGATYSLMGKHEEALDYLQQSYAIADSMQYKSSILASSNHLGEAYLALNELQKAKQYYEKAAALAAVSGEKNELKSSYFGLARIHARTNDYRAAFEYHELYSGIKDSILNEESSKQMAQMQTLYETEKKEQQILLQQEQIEKEQNIKYSVAGGAFMLMLFAGLLYNRYRLKTKSHHKLEEKNKIIEQKNKDITDSITYAQNIQQAILLSHEELQSVFSNAFVLNKPRDIISGDFYWVHKSGHGQIIWAVADCTGHGVPGALMSMIGNALLNEAVVEHKLEEPAEILDYLRNGVIRSFKEKGASGEAKDGMDIALCTLTPPSKGAGGIVKYAGANNPLYLIRNGELIEQKADRQPVGYHTGTLHPFTQHELEVQKNDIIYLFSDGFADQFGGPGASTEAIGGMRKSKKFTYKRFKKLLIDIHQKPMHEQKQILETQFTEWKGTEEQIDDVLVMGVKI